MVCFEFKKINLLVNAVCIFKQFRIPIHVKHIKKGTNTLVVNPENAIIKLRRTVWIVIQQMLQIWRPMSQIQLRIIPTPPQMRPRIFQL